MAYICHIFWCRFCFPYSGNLLSFPLIFLFSSLLTPLMNHHSYEAFWKISLPEVFLFPSGNFHHGIYHSALSFYESFPLGINLLGAEDWLFSSHFHCLEMCEWNGTLLHRRVILAKTYWISAGARLAHRIHRPRVNRWVKKPKHQLCTGMETLVRQIAAREEIMYQGQSGHHFLRILECNAYFVNEIRYATSDLTVGILY